MLEFIEKIRSELSDSYDISEKKVVLSNEEVVMFFIGELVDKSYISSSIIKSICEYKGRVTKPQTIGKILQVCTTGVIDNFDEAIYHILYGNTVMIFPFLNYAIYCETRQINSRQIEKTTTDSTLKGSNESFNELLSDNIGLIRKRVISSDLIVKHYRIGKKSQTSVGIVYISSAAPKDLVKHVCERVKAIEGDHILSANYIAEMLKTDNTSFETAGFYDNPDTIISEIFEGRIAIIVEGTPFVLTVPFFFFENFQSADDYYTNRIESAFSRFIRIGALLTALLLPALYIVLTTVHHSLIPTTFVFKLAVSRSGVPLPTVVEMILMQFFFELAREAGKRLPIQIGQSLSVVAGLILGESAVGMGLASQATVVVTGVYAICTFINPKLIGSVLRWSLLITTFSVIFGLHGFYICFLLFIAQISSIRSCGYPYLMPLGTVREFDPKETDILTRGRLNNISKNFLVKKRTNIK